MTLAITIKDVAREAGVSIATVSKILNHKPGISEKTTQHVHEVMETLGYVPNRHAASLARKTARSIAFLAGFTQNEAYSNPHLFDILCGVQDVLGKREYSLLMVDASGDGATCNAAKRVIGQKLADGMIVHASVMTRAMAALLAQSGFPHIIIGKPKQGGRLCWMDSNHALGGQLATEHLIARGYAKIAFIGNRPEEEISKLRLEGYYSALREHGVLENEAYVCYTESRFEQQCHAIHDFLEVRRPDALVCASNLLAAAAYKAAGWLGVDIPGALAVITFDMHPHTDALLPKPTLVHIKVFDMGREAAKSVLRMLKNPSLQVQSYTTLPEIVVNETTPPLRE